MPQRAAPVSPVPRAIGPDADVVVAAATSSLPEDLAALSEEATAAGIINVARLVERWRDGSERYDAPGESMLLARVSDVVVGVGGIAWCPDVAGALRVRRFYVSDSYRRRGIARMLATPLVDSGFEHTEAITCNAMASAAAAPFWESMGFESVDINGITHLCVRPPRHPSSGHVTTS